jgi:hypothetical protein
MLWSWHHANGLDPLQNVGTDAVPDDNQAGDHWLLAFNHQSSVEQLSPTNTQARPSSDLWNR